jgi:hypothetical protein
LLSVILHPLAMRLECLTSKRFSANMPPPLGKVGEMFAGC